MTRVDFYVLEAAGYERHQRTMCRIVGKAWQQGHQIFVRCGSQQDAATFDDLLWRFEDASFIPHTLSETAGDNDRVIIGLEFPQSHEPDVLINLAPVVSDDVSRYTRVVESAGYDDTTRDLARQRYRYYQERGFPLNTHKIKPN